MSQSNEYPAGTPIWVDLGSPDLTASVSFYTSLFGWQAEVAPAPEAGGYTTFKQDGKAVAGAGPLMNPAQPPAWSTYVRSDDLGATAQAVRDAGGQVLVEPFDVMGEGRMAVFADPAGATICGWQPQRMLGADLFNKPVSLAWNELQTPDVDSVKDFYQRVFGWGAATTAMEGMTYTEWKIGDKSIAGASPAAPAQGAPSQWIPYFAVASTDDVTARAREQGAELLFGPIDSPFGRLAFLRDPQNASFAVGQV